MLFIYLKVNIKNYSMGHVEIKRTTVFSFGRLVFFYLRNTFTIFYLFFFFAHPYKLQIRMILTKDTMTFK